MGKNRKRLLSALKYLFMALLVFYLFKSGRLSAEAFKPLFSLSSAAAFIFSIILILLHSMVFTKRYKTVIAATGHTTGYKELFKIVNIGIFFGNFLPSSAGGDIFRIYYLKNRFGIPIMEGTAITLLDRIFAFIGLIILSLISLAAVIIIKGSVLAGLSIDSALWAGVLAFPVLCVGALFLLRVPFFYNLAEKLFGIFGEKFLSLLSTARMLVKNSKVCLFSLSFAMLGQLLVIMAVTIIAFSMYGKDAALASIAVSGIVLASTAIPLSPGNIGWTEFAADILFKYMGSDGGAAVFLVWRAVFLVFSILGGFFYLSMNKKNTER
jgi:uncharacterized protein (TIRG00374 family)